jgi:low affinity Fe/Cu permease
MKASKNNKVASAFDNMATHAAKGAGSSWAFGIAFCIVIIWAICGPFFDFSETWQLVINTGTTIITFLMVFLIQKAQNKDSLAIQLKLNELVASNEYSSNRLVDIENMTEEEMVVVQKYYRRLSELSKKDESLNMSHSIEEAHQDHKEKALKNKIKKPTVKENTVKPAIKTSQKPTKKTDAKA